MYTFDSNGRTFLGLILASSFVLYLQFKLNWGLECSEIIDPRPLSSLHMRRRCSALSTPTSSLVSSRLSGEEVD